MPKGKLYVIIFFPFDQNWGRAHFSGSINALFRKKINRVNAGSDRTKTRLADCPPPKRIGSGLTDSKKKNEFYY